MSASCYLFFHIRIKLRRLPALRQFIELQACQIFQGHLLRRLGRLQVGCCAINAVKAAAS